MDKNKIKSALAKGIAKTLVGWLIKCAVIDEEEIDLYVFAGYSFLINFVPFILAVLVGGIIGNIRTGVERIAKKVKTTNITNFKAKFKVLATYCILE